MVRNQIKVYTFIFLLCQNSLTGLSQRQTPGAAGITASDLRSHVTFLASPLLSGRLNGSRELDIAANYIAAQACKIGLKPADGKSFIRPYSLNEKSIDHEKTFLNITSENGQTETVTEPFYQLVPTCAGDFEVEGEIVFTGYGIVTENYDDFDTLDLKDKILLVIDRAPVDEAGNCRFGEKSWLEWNGILMKIQSLIFREPKAVVFLPDPKTGHLSMKESYPDIAEQLESSLSVNEGGKAAYQVAGLPKVIFATRNTADRIFEGTGYSLAGLQSLIDKDLKPNSFPLKGRSLKITESSVTREKLLPNIAAVVEGSDPGLREEVVIFSAHIDHIGVKNDNVYPGADDNASGCAALLELAEEFRNLPKKPLRSVMFLWVSGEEIGLFGSEAYINNPVFQLEKTVADLNIDMIGRVKEIADSTSETPMTDHKSVFVITGNQSSELVSIADQVAGKNNITLDYSLSGRNHPLMLFARSDHFNFVRNDIPVLFFTTGIHTDYHKPGDSMDKLKFDKMEIITRTIFDIGYIVANKKERISVDNPFSKWENNWFR